MLAMGRDAQVVRGAEPGLTINNAALQSVISIWMVMDLVNPKRRSHAPLPQPRSKAWTAGEGESGLANPAGVGAQVRLVFADGTKGRRYGGPVTGHKIQPPKSSATRSRSTPRDPLARWSSNPKASGKRRQGNYG